MQATVREVNGYRLILRPDHPRSMKTANWLGYVYEHIVVATSMLGRQLRENEVVHHLDGNRGNNHAANLLVLERGQHSKLHKWIDKGAPGLETLGGNRVNSGKAKAEEPRICKVCSLTLQGKAIAFCSNACRGFSGRKVTRPSKDVLQKELLTESWTALGLKYSVSGNAVKNWAKKYGLLSQS
jgi:hypothetical protein